MRFFCITVMLLIVGCSSAKSEYTRSDCIVLISFEPGFSKPNRVIEFTGKAILDDSLGLAATSPKYSDSMLDGLYLQYKFNCEKKEKLTRKLIDSYFSKELKKSHEIKIHQKVIQPSTDTIDVSGKHWID